MRTKVYYSFVENKKEIRKCKMQCAKRSKLKQIHYFAMKLYPYHVILPLAPLIPLGIIQPRIFVQKLKSNFSQQHPHIKTGKTAKR